VRSCSADPSWPEPCYGSRVSLPALDEARGALARGDVLIAYDDAMSVLDSDPDDLEARLVAALALARAGIHESARAAISELLARIEVATEVPLWLREDAEALVGRLAKDRALMSSGPERAARLREAAALYEAVATKYGRYFSCINAATLRLLAGETERARLLAQRAVELASTGIDAVDDYWRCATEAEAALVLDDVGRAVGALERAARCDVRNYAARAVTRRQLRLVCAAKSVTAGMLDVLRPPSVLHYCGHRVDLARARRFSEPDQQHVSGQVREFLSSRTVGFGYGSVASGADILIAEALLAHGAELHVILPFDADEFEQTSVAPAGPGWIRRYRTCLERASSVRCVCDSAFLGDDELFAYAARIAMGHALNRARFLDTDAEQLAIWDGAPGAATVGTAHDVALWRTTGQPSHVIAVSPAPEVVVDPGAAPPASGRAVRAILFADFRGFSRLYDEHFASFVGDVLRSLGQVLDAHAGAIMYRNSWGDAIQAVFVDISSAAACAVGLQEALARHDLAAAGLPGDLGLRISVHAGPVMTMMDPVRHQLGVWGRELTRVARIEPRTPEGQVYVTDAFAALLTLEPGSGFTSEYVGRVTTAKDFETIPMYRLRRVEVEPAAVTTLAPVRPIE